MAMDKNIKARWVGKLREEGRRQTKSRLRAADGSQCCLDVLCEVAVEDNVIDAPKLGASGVQFEYHYKTEEGYDAWEYSVLPSPVIEWAGLIDQDPYIGGNTAANWNDDLDKTFLEIADAIEADENL